MNEFNPFGWGHLINHSDVPNVMYVDEITNDCAMLDSRYR